ncbi:MAG: pantoate--beta-alanine ligase [Planctomycetes bacterium]|nr:pantoate--beta-alanine ligase [Planctomycetota bacterium]
MNCLQKSATKTYAAVRAAQLAGKSIGLVPTMGALHEGHLSLVEASLAECDHTVVSIFVNPTQFGPSEDLASYPHVLEQDLRLLEERGCWLVFAPQADEMYQPGHGTYVDVGSVAVPYEGASRPTHFRGVATVVLKLFQIIPADRAYFGRKDYQQTLVIRKMVSDLNLPVEVRVCPIIREADGLAMSSRNAYLNAEERQRASLLWQSLKLAEQMHAKGQTEVAVIARSMRELLATDELEAEYIAFLAEDTVQEVTHLEGPTVVALAAQVGKTRLIDNHTIG